MRMIIAAAAAFAAFLSQALPASAQTAPAAPGGSRLTNLLTAELARWSGTGGAYVKNLSTGEEANVRGDQHFDSASTIKLSVMVLAYKLADEHKLNLNDRYVLKPSDYRGGSGIFRYHDVGLNPTLRDVITQMVITSDNSATDIMIAKVGGKDKVNEFLKQAGFATLHLNMTTNDYFRRPYELLDPKYKSLTPEDVFAMSRNIPAFTEPRKDMIARLRADLASHNINEEMRKRALDETTWLGIVSPAEMGRLIEGIERRTIASKEACDEMIRIMREQQSGTRKIPHWLNVAVAHKTGETAGVTNDVGVIFANSGPIDIALYTLGYTGSTGEADDRLGQVARLVVEYFDGVSERRGRGAE